MSDRVLEAVRQGTRVFDLAQPLHQKAPTAPAHVGFRFTLQRRHGDIIRDDGVSASNEMIMMSGHSGTHVDGLSHISCFGHLHGGAVAAEMQSFAGFKCLGVETVEPVVARGVLLDICALRGVDRLPNAHPITREELQESAKRASIEIGKGDVVLVRTGWAQLWDDPVAYVAEGVGVPGPTEDGARWLADFGVRMVGSDTTAFEHVPSPRPNTLPGHRLLIFERGINIIEMLNLEKLAAAQCAEFVFMLAPLKIVGATASPVTPIAVVAA